MKSIVYACLLGLCLVSCKKASTSKSTGAPKGAKASSCVAPLASGTVPPSGPVQAAGLYLTSDDISVNTSRFGGTSTVSIDVDPFKLGEKAGVSGEVPPFYIQYRICTSADRECLKQGKWHHDFTFSSAQLAKLPSGNLTISVKMCVDELSLVEGSQASALSNSCSKEEPCYCGKQADKSFSNTQSGKNADSILISSFNELSESRDRLFALTRGYHKDAVAYVNRCSADQKNNSAIWFQYAQNIANFSSSELAWISQNFGQEMQSFVRFLQTGSGLNLAETPPETCPAGTVDNEEDTGFTDEELEEEYGEEDFSEIPTDAGAIDMPLDSTGTGIDSGVFGTLSVNSGTSVTTTTSETKSGGALMLGGLIFVTGGILLADWGMKRFTQHRVTDIFNILGGTKSPFLQKVLGQFNSIGYATSEVNKSIVAINNAIESGDWDELQKARSKFKTDVQRLNTVVGKRFDVPSKIPTSPDGTPPKLKSPGKIGYQIQEDIKKWQKLIDVELDTKLVQKDLDSGKKGLEVKSGEKLELANLYKRALAAGSDIDFDKEGKAIDKLHTDDIKAQKSGNRQGVGKLAIIPGALLAILGYFMVSGSDSSTGLAAGTTVTCGQFQKTASSWESQISSVLKDIRNAQNQIDIRSSQR